MGARGASKGACRGFARHALTNPRGSYSQWPSAFLEKPRYAPLLALRAPKIPQNDLEH